MTIDPDALDDWLNALAQGDADAADAHFEAFAPLLDLESARAARAAVLDSLGYGASQGRLFTGLLVGLDAVLDHEITLQEGSGVDEKNLQNALRALLDQRDASESEWFEARRDLLSLFSTESADLLGQPDVLFGRLTGSPLLAKFQAGPVNHWEAVPAASLRRRILNKLRNEERAPPPNDPGIRAGASGGAEVAFPRPWFDFSNSAIDVDVADPPPMLSGIQVAASQPGAAHDVQPAGRRVARTPHLDSPNRPVPPQNEFTVTVYADDQPPAPGEVSDAIVIEDNGAEAYEIAVWLTHSSHFEILGPREAVLLLAPAKARSNDVTFTLRTQHAAALAVLPPEGTIAALFSYEGRPAGKVLRTLAISPNPPADKAAAPSAHPATLVVDPKARRADMELHITRDMNREPTQFECRVCIPGHYESRASWILPDGRDSAEFVKNQLALFCSKKIAPRDRPDTLRGVGKTLFTAAPTNFKDALWKLVDAGTPPTSIAVFSEEASIPWELMVPHRNGHLLPALGVMARVGRWVHPESFPPHQDQTLVDAYVFAPAYDVDPLKHAQEEAQFVCQRFGGRSVKPATSEGFAEALSGAPTTLIHFACHGRSGEHGQYIITEDGYEYHAATASGSQAVSDGMRKTPLVFFNACEVGRLLPSLAGPSGFAPVFVAKGASAVVAALWSVEDGVAHAVAQAIYNAIEGRPQTPLAQVLQELRAKAYATGGEDSYAAYCLYGDPNYICTRSP